MPSAPYQPYTAPTASNPIGYNNSKDARIATANQRQYVTGEGDALQNNDQQLASQYAGDSSGTQSYLNPIESNLAAGGGGYTSGEASQIQLTPAQEQAMTTAGGISAGVGTASAVGAADRAAAAGGGNPQAMATYRARAAQTQGADAGNAMTGARVAAQQAGSAGAQAVGNATLAQQNQGLGYFNTLQGEQNQNAQNEQGLQQGAYGTEAGAGTTATGQVLSASQTPSEADKLIGAAAGAAAGFLADGTSGYLGQDAVLGEAGPEIILEQASNPSRGKPTFMDTGSAPATPGQPAWLAAYLANAAKPDPSAAAQQPASQQWNPTTPYSQVGTALGKIAGKVLNNQQQQQPQNPTLSSPTASGAYSSPGGINADVIGGGVAPAADAAGGIGDAGAGIGDAAGGVGDAASGVGDAVGSGVEDLAGLFADGVMMASGGVLPVPHVPLGGYQPARYRPKQILADGLSGTPSMFGAATPLQAMSALQPAPLPTDAFQAPLAPGAKLITGPTRVHLAPGDAVVPLSYRPKAKVRPSAAMPALAGMMKPRHYGSSPHGGVAGSGGGGKGFDATHHPYGARR